MKLKRFLVFLVFSFAMGSLFAQDRAREILDQVKTIYQNKLPILSEFTLQQNPTMGMLTQSTQGALLTKEDKFILELGEVMAWFDGTSMWTYQTAHDEVEVRNPSRAEINAINPTNIFNSWSTLYQAEYKGQATLSSGIKTDLLQLIPKEEGTGMKSIQLWVAQADHKPQLLEITLDNEETFSIIFRNVIVATKQDKENFSFPASQYPDAEVIDLR